MNDSVPASWDLQRLLQTRCSTRSTSARRTRDKRGGRGGGRAGEGRGLHPKEPIKKGGFMNVSQSESSHLSPQNLHYTASPLQPFLSTSCLLSTLTPFFFFLHIRDIPLLKWMYSEHHREEVSVTRMQVMTEKIVNLQHVITVRLNW